MSIIYFGDLHLANFNAFSTTLKNGINSRLADQLQVVGTILDYIQPTDTVIFGGDLIDNYGETLSKIIYSAAHSVIQSIARASKQVYVLVGNHDIYRGMSILKVLDEISNVTVVQDTVTCTIEGWSVDLVPWEKSLPIRAGDLLFAHLMPLGAKLGKLLNKLSDTGVPISNCSNYTIAIFGHVHEPQIINCPGDPDDKVICPGSIMQLNLSSSEKDRRLYKINKDGTMSTVVIPSKKIYSVTIASQKEADVFVETKTDNYYKLTVTSPSIKLPDYDHTVIIEYDTDPTIGSRELDGLKEIDLLKTIEEFIDTSNTQINKTEAKKVLRGIY